MQTKLGQIVDNPFIHHFIMKYPPILIFLHMRLDISLKCGHQEKK